MKMKLKYREKSWRKAKKTPFERLKERVFLMVNIIWKGHKRKGEQVNGDYYFYGKEMVLKPTFFGVSSCFKKIKNRRVPKLFCIIFDWEPQSLKPISQGSLSPSAMS